MKINKVNNTYPVRNTLHQKNPDKPYDIVMTYCRYCDKRMDITVYHSFGKYEYYQIVNLPEKIAKYLDTRKINCHNCKKKFVLEKNPNQTKTDYLLKLDCSDMTLGMESWYEDAIPKYSNEVYGI